MSIYKNPLQTFYNQFHKKNSRTNKIINPNSFTYQNIIKIINSNLVNKGSKILDYGCGTGSIALYLSKSAKHVTGYDVSNNAISLGKYSAKENNQSNIFFTTKLSEIESRYDAIICIEVIEHVHDDKKLIKFFESKLNKGGRLILSTPSLNAPLYRLGLLENFDKSVGHLRRYDRSGLISLFKSTNFEIDEIILNESILRNTFFTFPKIGFLVKFLKFPFSSIVNWIDNKLIYLFGESDLIVVAHKK